MPYLYQPSLARIKSTLFSKQNKIPTKEKEMLINQTWSCPITYATVEQTVTNEPHK